MDSEQIIKRGRKAETVLKDEVLSEALDALKRDQITLIEGSSPADATKRESAYFMIHAIEMLKIKLNAFFSAGKLEERKNT